MPLTIRPKAEPLYVALEFEQFPAQVLAGRSGQAICLRCGPRPSRDRGDDLCPDSDPRRELRGKAFAVIRQSGESHKASVYAISAQARELGVEPGIPVFLLRRKFGGRVRVVPRDEEMEAKVLARLGELYEEWTPSFEVGRWGKTVLDLAGAPVQRGIGWEALAELVRARVQDGTGLTEVAVGVSRLPMLARALAREVRPAGVNACPPGQEMEALAELDLEVLPGMSGGKREQLRKYGIESVEQVRELERQALVKRLGRADGEGVYGLVRGVELRGRRSTREQVSAETVLDHDVNDEYALVQLVRLTVDKVCDQLRREGLVARRVAVQLTYTDNRRARRSVVMPASTDSFDAVAGAALGLFGELHLRRVGLKAIEVIVLRPGRDSGQLDLFVGDAERRQRSLGRAITDIRGRMGFGAVLGAAEMGVGAMVR